MGDPYWNSVVLLCHFDGADGATSAPDVSSSGHALSFQGSAALDTDQKKFGASSLWLPGSGDTVLAPDHADWQFGAGDFTIEARVRWAQAPSTFTGILTYYDTGTNQRSWTLQWEPGDNLTLWVSSNGSTRNSISRAWAPVVGQWCHVAGTRSGDAFRCYLDGQPSAALTWATSLHVPSGVDLKIGTQPGLHIDEVRITKGVARYGSSAFTPPAAAFPEGAPPATTRPVVIVAV